MVCHRQLAYMNPTTMQSLLSGYRHDDCMCTICIHPKHKQLFIKVLVKNTTKPFRGVHSDVCSPFSTVTLGNNRYYVLFIDDYTRYSSILLLTNKTGETCTLGYQSFQARVDFMGYRIQQFQRNNGWGEFDSKTFRYILAASGINTSQALRMLTIRIVLQNW